jgi:hypothetical protein
MTSNRLTTWLSTQQFTFLFTVRQEQTAARVQLKSFNEHTTESLQTVSSKRSILIQMLLPMYFQYIGIKCPNVDFVNTVVHNNTRV